MSLVRSFKAVAWSFLGIRKNSEYEQDLGKLNPLHVLAVGLVLVVVLVAALMAIVHWVVS